MKIRIFIAGLLLANTVHAQVMLLKRHSLDNIENARVVATTINSKRVILGGDKGTVQVYEPATGDSWNLPPHSDKVIALAVSYDNRYLASASDDGAVLLYDFEESKSLKLNGATGAVKALAFNPAARVLATGNDEGKISLWNVATREKISAMQGYNEKILALSFSPDGRRLASGSALNRTTVWDVESSKVVFQLGGHQDWIKCLAFSHDGNTLATGSYDKAIRLWDMITGAEKGTIKYHRGWVTDLHYSPDGKYLISGAANGVVAVMDLSGKVVARISDLGQPVCTAQFSFDGKFIATADLTSTIRLYDCTSLGIAPWRPYDIVPPEIAVLSPKLSASKDATTGNRRSTVHQSAVRLLLEVNDLSGVKELSVNGETLQPLAGSSNRYQFEATVAVNTEAVFAIRAVDVAGNKVEEKLQVEHKRFSGVVNKDKYHALLIAVQDYGNPSIPDLDRPAADLERLKGTLTTHYAFQEQNIIVLENPTRQQMYDALDEIQAKLDKIDNLLIFYAGHGYWDEQLEQGYWLPSDAEPNKRSTWLSNGALRDYIGGISARHTLLITDACFSGGIFKSRAVFENASTAIETLYLRKSRKAMTSGTLEKVPDKSVFIDYLVRRLQQNQEPYITAEELFSGLRKEVINNSPNNQVPQYGEIGQTGDEGGEFIFIRKN